MAATANRIAQTNCSRNEVAQETLEQPKSVQIASEGIVDATQFARLMAAIIADVGTGDITPGTANAMVNAGGKLLKIVDMRLRWGNRQGGVNSRNLQLIEQ